MILSISPAACTVELQTTNCNTEESTDSKILMESTLHSVHAARDTLVHYAYTLARKANENNGI